MEEILKKHPEYKFTLYGDLFINGKNLSPIYFKDLGTESQIHNSQLPPEWAIEKNLGW